MNLGRTRRSLAAVRVMVAIGAALRFERRDSALTFKPNRLTISDKT